MDKQIDYYKRRYKKTLQEISLIIQGELASLPDDIFEPSSAIDAAAFQLIQQSNRLKALVELKKSQ